MAYEDNQNEYPIPGRNDSKRTNATLLPRYFRTDANKKFIGSTLDQLTSPGVVEKLNGFVGSREAKASVITDNYISDVSTERENYQLEPYTIVEDDIGNVDFDADYLDLLGQISGFGGNTTNHDKLFAQEFYAWNPHIDFDKFTNFREYYWLPNGPQEIPVRGTGVDVVSTLQVRLEYDGGDAAFVFTPDGVTRNKILTLYRGQTYRFEVDTPGHPFGIALSRLKNVPYADSTEYVENLYLEGVSITEEYDDTVVFRDDLVGDGFLEKGVLEFTVPGNAPNNLYYISQNDINVSGNLNIFDIEAATKLDVTEEILGKKTYRTNDGWDFSNGMKVYFTGEVIPESYTEGLYYVEGVGESIELVAVKDLQVPAIFTQDTEVPFDINPFDRVPFGDAKSFAGTKDYVCINRRDKSKNPWSRYNRWTHKSVIEKSAEINNTPIEIFEDLRARRPIIEFEPDLRLFNHGNKAKTAVDLVDTFTKDVFSTIEGSSSYNVDGIDLADGMRILFTGDPDSLVNGKIFEVNYITHNNNLQISLIETIDTLPVENETILILDGNKNAGCMYWYNGTQWNKAQDKGGINQSPLFDLFDADGNSIGDQTIYDSTEFIGNRIFNYKVGEGANDDELGFPLTYQNFVNIGDIVFDFPLLNKSYNYKVDKDFVALQSDRLFLKKYVNETDEYVNAWKKATIKSQQYVVRRFTGEEYVNNFPIDVYNNSASLDDLKVKVYVNSQYKTQGSDYTLVDSSDIKTIVFNNDIEFTDIVVIKTHSKADKNLNGYYEIPDNLERNPLNQNITEFTLGEVNDHVEGLITEISNFQGVQPGISNLRDLGDVSSYGRKFVQHSGPINLPMYMLVSKNANLIKSVRYASNEYQKFKRQFIQIATDNSFNGTVKEHVDFIFNLLNEDKTQTNNFYSTDMAGTGGSVEIQYEVLDNRLTTYALSKIFSKDVISNVAVYVYINDEQLTHGKDYTFTNTGFVNITKAFANGDVIKIFEYANTEGSFIPPTPSKLGLYPAYVPEKFLDTSYKENANVLRGHDGSIMLAYDDYRDDLLLELEKRIYNNIKITYDTDIFDIDDVVGGFSRNTGVSRQSIDDIIISDFVKWLDVAKINDYTYNDFLVQGDSFTYNYSKSTNLKGQELPGFWRGVYIQAFDTDRPHTHPWEMLGYASEPTWWQEVYGPAPYTSNNLILWSDLQKGLVREPNQPIRIRSKYIRTNLLDHLPVNENGQLLSPLESGYAQNFSFALQQNTEYKFGDYAPVETAWRRSSGYAFSILVAMILLRPAHTIGIGLDRSRIVRDKASNLVYENTNKRINTKDIIFPGINGNITGGLLNYLSQYINLNTEFSYSSMIDAVKNIDNKIGFKVAGYANKEKLKLVLDSKTPTNQGNVFIPFENYKLTFRSSAPQKVVTYSGVIIEKVSRGYKISGYDQEEPYFYYNAAIESANDPVINVGGISESFSTWNENKTYVAGKIVEFNDRYYRVNVTHTSEESFDETKFSPLKSLPQVGGVNAYFRKRYDTNVSKIDYGTVYSSIQDVVDFLLGYQKYLISQGFVFDYFNRQTEAVENWSLAAKEFMFWTSQNWAASSIITLSPAANNLVFSQEYYVVDDLFNSFYNYPVLNQNSKKLNNNFFNVFRDNANNFQLKSDQDGIFLIKLPLIQKEHVVLIDNTTVFNDVIFSKNTGYRQQRIKVVGYRTDEWNGSLNIPGFLYDDARVTEWESYKDYVVGELVKFKEFYYAANITHSGTEIFENRFWSRLPEKPENKLQPNWDYRANQFADFYDLDTDNFDAEQQRLAQHLIGYQKRNYLSNIIQDDVSQYKFYQGFIQDKGTTNSITKLFDKLGSANQDSIELYEEWAIRVGQYGAVTSFDEVEFRLDEKQFRIEPQTIELVNQVDQTRTDLVYQYPSKDALLKPANYDEGFLPVNSVITEYTKTGGYVKLDQIDFLAKVLEDILTVDIDTVDIGSYVWTPKDDTSWMVYRHVLAPYKITRIEKTDLGFRMFFNTNIELEEDAIIGINNIDNDVNGFWLASNIQRTTVILEDSTVLDPNIEIETDNPISTDYIDLSDSTEGIVTEFCIRRVTEVTDINIALQTYDLNNDKFWVDDAGSGVSTTFENKPILRKIQNILAPQESSRLFGQSVAASYNNTIFAVGVPDIDDGKVYVYTRGSDATDLKLYQTLEPMPIYHDDRSQFGDSVALSANGQYLYVGAPLASNVKSRYKGFLNPLQEYDAGDIVSSKGVLWEAQQTVTVESSTINLESYEWRQVKILKADPNADPLSYTDQGVVYIYKKLIDNTFDLIDVICSSAPGTNEKFGIGLKVVSPGDYDHTLYVRSLADNGRLYIINNGGQTDVESYEYNIDENYRGEWQSIAKYIENEVVYYEGYLYQANQTVFPGNPFDLTLWNQLTTLVDYTGYISNSTLDANYLGEWTISTSFSVGDIVSWNGINYKAQVAHTSLSTPPTAEELLLDPTVVNDWLPNLSAYWTVTDVSTTDLYNEDSSGFGYAADVGITFDISKNGEVIALSGVLNAAEFRVAIYRKQNGRYVFDQNIDSPVDNEFFGHSVSLNDLGDKLAIGAPDSDEAGITNGQVYVYKLQNNQFELDQKLFSPDGEKNNRFGVYVDLDADKLAVTSERGDTEFFTTFDVYSVTYPTSTALYGSAYVNSPLSGNTESPTIFDNGATTMTDSVKDNSRVYLYETINNKLIYSEKLMSSTDISQSSMNYGYLNRNHLYMVAPSQPLDTILDDSTNNNGIIQDYRNEINETAWTVNSQIEPFVNLSKIKGVWLYDNTTKDLITYLDFIDPIQGRIAGPAEQELTYKLYYDPAVYNVGSTDTGTKDLWTTNYVGKLWWNLDTIKWFTPYQGDLQFKTNTWNTIIPGFDVDVYEWVESDYLPSEYDGLADTTEGLAEGISGTSLYGDETYTVANSYDPVTGIAIPKYYFWVKSKSTIPNTYGRKISALDVENLIKDPAAQGYRYINLFDSKNYALHNVRNLIKDKDTILHIDYFTTDNEENNIHSEYQLLTEGLASSKPNKDIVDKWVDSLVGYNEQNIQLPDTRVSIARRFGILNEPNQSMFVNRKEALKQIIERTNGILTQHVVVDEFDISPLMQIDPKPSKFTHLWDTEIESESLLRFIGTAKISQAKLNPIIQDGVIVEVEITDSGRGYIDSNYIEGDTRDGPTVTIEGTGTGAEIKTYINNLGQVTSVEIVNGGKNYLDNTVLIVRPFSVLVKNDTDVGGFWAIYNWISSTGEWFRNQIQDYDTTLFWNYIDWYAEGYNAETAINFIIPGAYALESIDDKIGSVVKIETIGTGGWLLLEKIDNQTNVDYTVNYKSIGRQNGTIQFSSQLYQNDNVGYDKLIYDTSFYDREPSEEIRIILKTIEENLFVDQLEVEWNKLFFSSIRYAISEQVDVDWIFKSSFVTAKHNVGELKQKITYQNDNLPNYQEYINEVKPFSTKVREYISAYEKVEPTQTVTTDFDLPPSYDAEAGKVIPEAIKFVNNELTNVSSTALEYPKRNWLDNVGFEIKEFVIFNGGKGYINTANVTVSGGGGPTLEGFAYIGGDSITFIDVNTNGARYFNTPTVTINGGLTEGGEEAIVYAIIGNNLVRNTHMLMRFDRVSGNYLFTTLNETETFVGNGGLTEFNLKWPASTRSADISITVAGVEQLVSDFTISNELDQTKSFTRYKGRITFTTAPANNAEVVINYKKATDLLTAADRINFYYNPTTGMPGKDLAQLMDGIDYDGVQMDSIGFGESLGFDLQPFGVDFDTFDTANEDEVIVLDGSTQVVNLSKELEAGVEYNVYLNNVRIDDPNYPNPGVNPNAKMVTITGDGISKSVFLDSDVIETQQDDVVIVRKSTSDGSFTPESTAFDVSLQGGTFETTTATGIEPGEVVVDGDGFVTEKTSKGPEEQVPGQVLDTLDITVFNRVSIGQGLIAVRNYITDGNTLNWEFDLLPQTENTVIVTVDGEVIDNANLDIDYENKLLSLADSTVIAANKNLSILCIGTNGVDIIDSDIIVADGTSTLYELPILFTTQQGVFVTVNGVKKERTTEYGYDTSDAGFGTLEFPTVIPEGAIIQYTVYSDNVNQFSEMVIDKTMLVDGTNRVHRFENDVVVPFVKKPYSHNILVQRSKGSKFLNPGYRKSYTMTLLRDYDIDAWQFEDTTLVNTSDVQVYINNEPLDETKWNYDSLNGRVEILSNNIGLPGDLLEIFIIRDAEYFFFNTIAEIEGSDGHRLQPIPRGTDVAFKLTDDSTVVNATVENFSYDGDNAIVELQGYVRDLFQFKSIDDTPAMIANDDSTPDLRILDVRLQETNNLTLLEAPEDWEDVNIYTFSNHDINEFERNSYDVVWNTSQAPQGSQEYIDKNLLSTGYVKLQKPALSANYVWVFKNGIIQVPQKDYKITERKDGVQMYEKVDPNDTIDVLQFAAPVSKPKFGFRIFKDMLNRFHYKRLNNQNEYELQQPLNYYDQSIQLKDATGLESPNRALGLPGVLWINKERIEYFSLDGNVLRQLRRGTLGTGVNEIVPANTKVIGQGIEENIPYKDAIYKTRFNGDNSTKQFLLDWTPTSVNEFDVYFLGFKLRKDSITTFDPTVDQDSPEADVTIAPEFTMETIQWGDETRVAIILADYIRAPSDNAIIEVVRKEGRIWNEQGLSIADSENEICKFITDKTISLPR